MRSNMFCLSISFIQYYYKTLSVGQWNKTIREQRRMKLQKWLKHTGTQAELVVKQWLKHLQGLVDELRKKQKDLWRDKLW